MLPKSETRKSSLSSRRQFLQRAVVSGAAAYGALDLARTRTPPAAT